MTGQTELWAREFLGKEVVVTLDHDEPRRVRGTLLRLTDDGQVDVREESGVMAYCWPCLNLEAADMSDDDRVPPASSDELRQDGSMTPHEFIERTAEETQRKYAVVPPSRLDEDELSYAYVRDYEIEGVQRQIFIRLVQPDTISPADSVTWDHASVTVDTAERLGNEQIIGLTVTVDMGSKEPTATSAWLQAEGELAELLASLETLQTALDEAEQHALAQPDSIGARFYLIGLRTAANIMADPSSDPPLNLYDVALQVTDEAFGPGTYAANHRTNPDPGVQAAIARATTDD